MKKMIILALAIVIGAVNYTQGATATPEYHRMTPKELIASREESVRDWTEVLNAIERGKRVPMDSPAYQRAQRALKHAQRMPGEGKAVAEWTTILSALERGKKIDTASPEFSRVHAARAKSETRLNHLRERPTAKKGGILERLGFGGAKKTEKPKTPKVVNKEAKKVEVKKKAHAPVKKSGVKAKRGAVATTDVKKAKKRAPKAVVLKKSASKKAEAKPTSKKKAVKKPVKKKRVRAPKRPTGLMHL